MAGTVMTMFAVWYVYPWQPRLIIHYQLARELLRFGIPIVSLGAFAVFFDSLDRLIIGRSFDSSALGLYTLATRLPELLILNSLWVVTGAIFPVYATIQEQTDSLRKSFSHPALHWSLPDAVGVGFAAGSRPTCAAGVWRAMDRLDSVCAHSGGVGALSIGWFSHRRCLQSSGTGGIF